MTLLLSVLALNAWSAEMEIWDLKKDWSDAANPNGVWSLNEGGNPLPLSQQLVAIDGWGGPQPAWAETATGNHFLPLWYRSTGNEPFPADVLAGDVVMHSIDPTNGVGNGEGNVTWTSPVTGTVSIAGGAWMIREIGRGNDWKLYKNATLLSSGHIQSGDAYNRANPSAFRSGSGGVAAVQNIAVVPGDVLKLEIVRTSTDGDFVAVDFRILRGSIWNSGTGANGHTYIPVKAPGGITWPEAESAAVAAGGHLASIGSAEENAFVYALISGDPDYWFTNGSGHYIGPWLGGMQAPVGTEPAGGWQWSDGTGFGFTRWGAGNPNNTGGIEDRTVFFNATAAPGSDWDDVPASPVAASRPRGYIVEITGTEAASTVWNTGPGANGHSYQAVYVPGGINWPDAEAAAVARGGHLVSIGSAEENAFAFSLVGNRPEFWFLNVWNASIGPYIGGFQPDGSSEPSGGYQWSDGTPFTYTNWRGGEPNNSGGLEKYIHFYGGGSPEAAWNDMQIASLALGYIIEFSGTPGEPAGPEFADILYVSIPGQNSVCQYRIAPTGTPQLLHTLANGMNIPTGLASSPRNQLMAVQRGALGGGNAHVQHYTGARDTPVFVRNLAVPNPPALNSAHSAAFAGDRLLVVDSYNNQLRMFEPDAVGVFAEKLPVATANISDGMARGVEVNPLTGEAFVSLGHWRNQVVRFQISPAGAMTPNGIIEGNGLSNPHGIAFSPWGEMFVANFNSWTISRFTFDAAGNAVANGSIEGNGLNGPTDVAFSPWGELFVGNNGNGKLLRFKFDSNGAALSNGSMDIPGGVYALEFVRASAPELPPPCVPGVTTSVSDGLIGWWKGDGNASDAVGKNPGTEENGVTYEPGRFGQAFRVGSATPNPNSPRVNLGHLPDLKGASAWTLSVWVKASRDNAPNGPEWLPYQHYIGLPVGNLGAGLNAPYFARGLWAGANCQFSGNLSYTVEVGSIPMGMWTHIAGVWDSKDGWGGASYKDGHIIAGFRGTPDVRFPEGSGNLLPAYIGAMGFHMSDGSTFTNTSESILFDDMRLYNRALSEAEIALIASGDDFNTCPMPDAALPPLTVTQVPAGVKLSWPARFTGWSLQSGPSLQSWAPVPGTPLVEGDQFTVTKPLSGGKHFFRLVLIAP
ncbi:MAG: hypothetical protein KA004_09065 [Verrucomicrobiales bacterium]|nr:hypothetical protein [Verrucomicrobiales bacterium]